MQVEKQPLLSQNIIIDPQQQQQVLISNNNNNNNVDVNNQLNPENINEDNIPWAPPPDGQQSELKLPQQPQGPLLLDIKPFTEIDAKDAIEAHVNKSHFLRRDFTNSLIFTNFVASNAYIVSVDTFVEGRKMISRHRPYRGGPVDGPNNGIPPNPWNIFIQPPTLWTPHKAITVLPHTEVVQCCFRCNGHGHITCLNCHGHGHTTCTFCQGSGHRHQNEWYTDSHGHRQTRQTHVKCHSCHHGHVSCFSCHGHGHITCPICLGCRDLVHYKELQVKWEIMTFDGVIKSVMNPEMKSVVTDDIILKSEGTAILREENVIILPLVATPNSIRINEHVNNTANDLIGKSVFPAKLQHMQRLKVTGTPVYEATYFQGGHKHIWIVGIDRRVYCPGYPKSIPRVMALVLGILLPIIIALILVLVLVVFKQH